VSSTLRTVILVGVDLARLSAAIRDWDFRVTILTTVAIVVGASVVVVVEGRVVGVVAVVVVGTVVDGFLFVVIVGDFVILTVPTVLRVFVLAPKSPIGTTRRIV